MTPRPTCNACRHTLACLIVAAVLAACGGGGGGGEATHVEVSGYGSSIDGNHELEGGGGKITGSRVPGAGVEPLPPPLTGDVSCVGLTIGALRLDNVDVPDNASCTLVGTIINGTLAVGANARLIAQNINITGDLTSDSAAVLSVSGTSAVGGTVQVQRGPGADLRDIAITGDLQIDAMTGPVYAFGNKVLGNLLATANRGKLILAGNQMGGAMQCTDDLPAPTGAGNIASLKQGQCAGL